MVRTIVQLTDEQVARLRELASRRRVSIAALVRQGVDRVLAEDERASRVARIMSVAGKYTGPPDLGARHDDYLAEAYAVVGRVGQPSDDEHQ